MFVPRSIVALAIILALSLFLGARTQANPMRLDTGWAGPHPSQIRSFSASSSAAGPVQLVPPVANTSPFKSFVVTDVSVTGLIRNGFGHSAALSDGSLLLRIEHYDPQTTKSFRSGLIFDARAGVQLVGPDYGYCTVSGYYY